MKYFHHIPAVFPVSQEDIHATLAAARTMLKYSNTNPEIVFLHMPSDDIYHASYTPIIDKLAARTLDFVVLVGIGGSAMGTLAVHHALEHHLSSHTQLMCADTIDPIITPHLLAKLRTALHEGKTCFVCIISKSGTTLETNVNATLIINLFKEYHPTTYQDMIVMITDEQSPVAQFSQRHNIPCAYIPASLGGRFSVFSAVGILPLTLLGHDTHELRAGARRATEDSFTAQEHDQAARIAQFLFVAYQNHMPIHDWFIFAPHYYSLGLWNRQLIAESLGKQSPQGPVGITPTVSLGTVDLHSVAQLYLAGPAHTTTTFIMPHCKQHPEIILPTSELMSFSSKSITSVHAALYRGIIDAYDQHHKPYITLDLTCSAYDLGYIMQTQMIATVYLAQLLQVNPFDQPAITAYKQAAYRHLHHA
jgi:glucose-6-phosphate isomerase